MPFATWLNQNLAISSPSKSLDKCMELVLCKLAKFPIELAEAKFVVVGKDEVIHEGLDFAVSIFPACWTAAYRMHVLEPRAEAQIYLLRNTFGKCLAMLILEVVGADSFWAVVRNIFFMSPVTFSCTSQS